MDSLDLLSVLVSASVVMLLLEELIILITIVLGNKLMLCNH